MSSNLQKPKNIICFATRRIDDRLPTNVQQVMVRLARDYRVLYVEPPVDRMFLCRNPDFLQRRHAVKSLYPSLYPLCPLIFPFERRIPLMLSSVNRYRIVSAVRREMKKRKLQPDIVWLFRPDDLWLARRLHPAHICYHVTDKYIAMPQLAKTRRQRDRLLKMEAATIKHADIIFCTARSLWREVSARHPNAFYVGNVADVEHFAKACLDATIIPGDISSLPRPIVGFFGAISSFKIDYSLLKVTAAAFQNGSLVMIGPIRENKSNGSAEIPHARNIYYLGTRDYELLPNYLKGFDVCIIPYRQSHYTRHVFPLKFFEYLAAGKPVVSTPLPALEEFSKLFYSANDSQVWRSALQRAFFEDDPEKHQARKDTASANSWPVRIKQIKTIIEEL